MHRARHPERAPEDAADRRSDGRDRCPRIRQLSQVRQSRSVRVRPDAAAQVGPFNAVTAAAAMHAALAARAVAIAGFTISGTTARLLSQQRPHVPIIAFSPDQAILRRMAFYWGVEPKISSKTNVGIAPAAAPTTSATTIA